MRIVFFPYEDKAIYYGTAAQIKKNESWNFFGNAHVSVKKVLLQTKVFLSLAN